MTIKVLGPLDTGGELLSPRERAVFAALILRRGTGMSAGELAEAYWGETPPQTWGQQVKTSIARIRGRLGKQAVRTTGSEYALGLDPDVIDAVRFEGLVSAARTHTLHDESDRAVDSYRRALAMWRGPAYPELVGWGPGVVEAMRLDEIRRSAEEELVEARLHAGEHRAVVADAERLVREQPLREDRWAILALANYQTGRQADALATLRAARERLLDELGIEPGARLTQLETAILRQDPSLSPTFIAAAVSTECPYRGLSAYGPDDADAFFGRDAEIEEALARVLPGAVVTVAGPSGSGKSSMVLAGVVPRLRARGRRVHITRPDAAGLAALAWTAADDAVDVLVIDQTEELLRLESHELEEFCAAAGEFLLRGTVILTVRSDFLDQIASLPVVGAAAARGIFLLGPLSPIAMHDAIVEPARNAGLRLEAGLVELVLRDAGDRSGILPALSHALQETWVRREGATLTVYGYEASGGIAGAVAQSAEHLFEALEPTDRDLCRSIMTRLIERGEGGGSIRRRATAAPLLDDPDRRRVIGLLVRARLVTIDGDAIMVAHEAVATAWPRLDAWLDEDAEGARITRTLETAAAAWDAAGRPDDDLLRGARLQSAIEWREASGPDLTALETAFLGRSAEREQSELRSVSARAAHDRRQNRRLRWALGGSAALLVVALVSGGIAVVRGRDAAAAAQDSLIEAVTAKSTSLRQSNRDIAALMAVEAYRQWPADPRTRAALMASMTAAGAFVGATYLEKAEQRSGIYPIPGADQVVVAKNSTVRIDDLRTGKILRTLTTDLPLGDSVIRPWVRVSADGNTAVILQHRWNGGPGNGDDSELVSFFDIASGHKIGDTVTVPGGTDRMSVSNDGRSATWAFEGAVIVADRDTGLVHRTEAFEPADKSDVPAATSTFTSAGDLVVGNLDGDVWEVDPTTFAPIARWSVPTGYAEKEMVVTADGTIYSTGREGIIATNATGRELWRHRFERPLECTRIAATSTTGIAACGDENGIVEVRDLWTGEIVVPATSYQLGGPGDLAFVDQGRELLLLSATAPAIGKARVDGAGPDSAVVAAGMRVDGGLDSNATHLLVESKANDAVGPRDQGSFAVWDLTAEATSFRIPQDVVDPYDGILARARWITDDVILTWQETWTSVHQDSPDRIARVIDLRTGHFLTTGIPSDTTAVYPSTVPGRVLVSTMYYNTMMAIDTATLQPVETGQDSPPAVYAVSDTMKGTRFVQTHLDEQNRVFETRIVDAKSGEVIAHGLPTYQDSVGLPDGDVVAADGSSLSLFSGTDLSPVRRLPVSVSFADSLQVSADGGTLLAAGYGEHAFAVVDLAANLPIGDPISDGGLEEGASLAADGSTFALPGRLGVMLWSLDPEKQVTAACLLAGRELTADEWTTYLGELGPQKPICKDVLG